MYVVTTFATNKILTQLIAHAIAGPYSGLLDGLFLGLAKAPSGTLNPSQGLSALTEANYAGYARQAVVWHGPYTDLLQNQAVQSGALYFAPTGSTPVNTITMMFLADALTGGNLILSEALPGGPIEMDNTSNAFGLAVVFQLASQNNYGDVTVIQ